MKRRRLGLLLTAFQLLLFPLGYAQGQPVLQGKTSLPIDWECEFYYAQLLTPADLAQQCGAAYTVESIPSSWTRYRDEIGKRLPARGCATYRVRCVIRNSGDGQRLALYIPYVRSSYALWIDGVAAPGVGKISAVPYEAKPGIAQALVPFTLRGGESGGLDTVEIVLQVANYTSPRAGIVEPMRVGDYDTLRAELSRAGMWVALLLGALLMLLVANVILYSLRKERRINVWVSVLLLFVILAVATSVRSQLLILFPTVNWDLYLTLCAGARLGAVASLLMLLRSQYPTEMSGKLAYPLALVGGLATIVMAILPARIYLRAEWAGIVYYAAGFAVALFWVLPRAVRRGRGKSKSMLVGLAALGVAIVLDSLAEMFWPRIGVSFSLLTVGLLAVLLWGATMVEISQMQTRMRAMVASMRCDSQMCWEESKKLNATLRQEQQQRARLEEAAHRRQWIDEGQVQLRKVLIENRDNLSLLCQKSLEEMARCVKSKVGVLYVARISRATQELELQLLASYGLDEEQRASCATCAVGEGVIGASFLDNTARVMKDVPRADIAINSGLGRSAPRSLVVQPLESDAGLVGVLELGRFAPYADHEIDFIQRSSPQVANSIMYSSSSEDSRRQIELLRKALQEKSKQ